MQYNEHPTYEGRSNTLGLQFKLTVDTDVDELRKSLSELRQTIVNDCIPGLLVEVDRLIQTFDTGCMFIIEGMGFDPWHDDSADWISVTGFGLLPELVALKIMLDMRGDADELAFMERWFRIVKEDMGNGEVLVIRHPMTYAGFLMKQCRRMRDRRRVEAYNLCYRRPRLRSSQLLVRALTA